MLLEVISKLETTTKELEKVKKQLEIAKEALKSIKSGKITIINPKTRKAEYMESYALDKIEELDK